MRRAWLDKQARGGCCDRRKRDDGQQGRTDCDGGCREHHADEARIHFDTAAMRHQVSYTTRAASSAGATRAITSATRVGIDRPPTVTGPAALKAIVTAKSTTTVSQAALMVSSGPRAPRGLRR